MCKSKWRRKFTAHWTLINIIDNLSIVELKGYNTQYLLVQSKTVKHTSQWHDKANLIYLNDQQ
jgi:hypothetical protein